MEVEVLEIHSFKISDVGLSFGVQLLGHVWKNAFGVRPQWTVPSPLWDSAALPQMGDNTMPAL